MRAVEVLPEGYKEYYSINLQKDKKTAILINGTSIIIMALMFFSVNEVFPFVMFLFENGNIKKLMIMFLLLAFYVVLHELMHGIAMKICGTKRVKYGFTSLYAFAGSDDYYDKKSYIFIALAPIVFWGMVIAVILLLVPADWFWVFYFIQIYNISGAAGDLFVTVKFLSFPKDILIRDYGVSMTVFSKCL